MLLLAPRPASAIQLHWNDGATAMTFTAATRCTLVVQADSTEQRLPSEWRLLWVADSTTDISPVPLGEQQACVASIAQVSAVDEPSTPADSAAHLRTAHFCSDENDPAATVARYMLDLPAGSAGKLKAVALDSNDSTQVIESSEVTFNGGTSSEYAPVLLSATTTHETSLYTVHAIGLGLAGAQSVNIGAPDGQWRLSLGIRERSDSGLTASTDIVCNVPACVFQVSDGVGATSISLPANATLGSLNPEWVPSLMREAFTAAEKDSMQNTPPNGRIQPKDFALLFAQHKFHVFYIRLSMWDPWYRAHDSSADSTEKSLGHARSWDLSEWQWAVPPATTPIDTIAFAVRPGTWDSFHVWAPYIVQTDSMFYMFYTGVGDTVYSDQIHRHHQRLGVATSLDLDIWTRYNPILSVFDVPWASRNCQAVDHGSQQLRDPFVMPDPARAGHWLMYFAAIDSAKAPAMAIGVARSNGDLLRWTADDHPIRSTDRTATGGAFRVESPHVFAHENRWWLCFTPGDPNGGTNGTPYNPVAFVMSDSLGDPTDTLATAWSAPESLYKYQPYQSLPLDYWHASEHLVIGDHEYLAAWDDWNMGIAIGEMNWYGPHDFLIGSASVANLAVSNANPVGDRQAHLSVMGARPARSRVDMRVELPVAMRVRLVVFDVAGRRVKTITDRELQAGSTNASWDGRDADGRVVTSGIYFARMTCPAGDQVVKAVLLR